MFRSMKKPQPKPRGFQVIPKAQGVKIAAMGGKAISAGKRGRAYMADLGRRGGLAKHKPQKAA